MTPLTYTRNVLVMQLMQYWCKVIALYSQPMHNLKFDEDEVLILPLSEYHTDKIETETQFYDYRGFRNQGRSNNWNRGCTSGVEMLLSREKLSLVKSMKNT